MLTISTTRDASGAEVKDVCLPESRSTQPDIVMIVLILTEQTAR